MNKFKRIAAAVVSIVMAGTMAASLAACTNDDEEPDDGKLKPHKVDGKLAYDADMELPIAIGHNNAKTGTNYDVEVANLVDSGVKIAGYNVTEGTLKPTWQALQSVLGLKFKNEYGGEAAGKQIATLKNSPGLDKVAVFTASLTTITTESASGTLLNVADYLDEMPNYKAFLEANPVVWASLISNVRTGAMYMLPYFDGNDDIEKYVLLRKDLVEALLDTEDVSAATTTFKAQADAKKNSTDATPSATIVSNKATVTSFMGKTGNYEVSTDVAGGVVRVNYDAAKTAANNPDSELGKAVRAAYASVGTLDSGNIVDIQNAVINGTSGAVTGAQLIKITQEYIKVAYEYKDGSTYKQLYGTTVGSTTTKLSDVFNSAFAAWDVDLYVALGRCYVTGTELLGAKNRTAEYSYLVAGRAKDSQRESDLYSLAGELYGVRGLESRNNFAYIDQDGKVRDARANEASWNATARLHELAVEGLLDTTTNTPQSLVSSDKDTQTLSMHDYVQTQTKSGFGKELTEYNFAPVLTPVSHWDVNDDGTAETTMRFTESWRGVKDGGLAVSTSYIGNDSKRLSAMLKFIDYCYSDEGQILMTYGPVSTTDSDGALKGTDKLTENTFNNNGMWVGTEVEAAATSSKVATYNGEQYYVKPEYKADYFTFGGKVYTGLSYNGRQIPKLTKESVALFGHKKIGNNNFTNYARQFLGTTLPCFNKDQGFEYQCTSECGKAGALIVANQLVKGNVKHPYQTLNGKDDKGQAIAKVGTTKAFTASTGTLGKLITIKQNAWDELNKYFDIKHESTVNMWYTLMPTTLPYSDTTKTSLSTSAFRWLTGAGGDESYLFQVAGKKHANAYVKVIKYGFDVQQEIVSGGLKLGGDAAKMIKALEELAN